MHGRFALQIWLLGLLLTVDVEAQDTFIREVMPETREELLLRITRHTPVYGLAVAQDGVFAAASDVLRVWDGISGSSLVSLVGLYASPFQAAAFSPDGSSIVGLSAEGEMNAWAMPLRFKASYVDRQLSASTGRNKAHHGLRANAVTFSPDGKLVVSAAADNPPIKLWDSESGVLIRGIALPEVTEVTSIAFSPSGDILALGTPRDLVLLKTSDWTLLRTIKGHESWIRGIAFASDGQTVITASDDKTARLWKIESGEAVMVLNGHTASVRSVAFSPNGELIATGGLDKTARVWSAEGKPVGTISHPRPVYAVGFNDAGTELVTGAGDNTVRLWRVPDWKLTQRMVGTEESTSKAFLFETRMPVEATKETVLVAPVSPMKDAMPKATFIATRELATLGNQIVRLIHAGQADSLEALFSPDEFRVDGPTWLQDREAVRALLFETPRLRGLIASRQKVEAQRFRSIQEILRIEGGKTVVQVLERPKTPAQEDAGTLILSWSADPLVHGLYDYPRFGVARTNGMWRIVDVTTPLDIQESSRYAIAQQRTRLLRSFTDSLIRTILSDNPAPAAIATTLRRICRENVSALAYELSFAKGDAMWLPPNLDSAEIVFRWDGDPEDYQLTAYPGIKAVLENGSWQVRN